MKKSNVFSLAVFAVMFTAACSSEFKVTPRNKAFVTETGSPHQNKNMSQFSIATQLRKLDIDITDVKFSKETLDNKFIESKKQDLEKISELLHQYIETGMEMIALGDNDESSVVTVENAKELKKMSISYAVTLSPELNF